MARVQSLKTLQTLYGFGFLALVIMAGVAGAVGLALHERWADEARRIDALQRVAEQARGDLYRQTKEIFDFHFLADPQAGEQYRTYAARIDEKLARLDTLAATPAEREAIARLTAAYAAVRSHADSIMARESGAIGEGEKLALFDTELELGGHTAVEHALDSADAVFLLGESRLEQRVAGATRLAAPILLVPIGLAALLLWFSRGFLQRAFVTPLSDILRAMAVFGGGDLDHRVREQGASEMIDLQRAINHMADDVAHSRAALVRAEKQAALGALVPMVAHNIRNPLASIRATAQLMGGRGNPDEAHTRSRSILSAVDRLSDWLTALLSYLNPKMAHRVETSLAECADHALVLLAPRLEEKALTVRRTGWGDGGRASLDAHLMEQTIYGLLANAAEASPHDATLTLSVGRENGRCWLTIADRGAGLPFEPRPDGALPGPSTKSLGSGLGIPFAYKICELHDGALAFRQASDGGTEATVTVPAASPARTAA